MISDTLSMIGLVSSFSFSSFFCSEFCQYSWRDGLKISIC